MDAPSFYSFGASARMPWVKAFSPGDTLILNTVGRSGNGIPDEDCGNVGSSKTILVPTQSVGTRKLWISSLAFLLSQLAEGLAQLVRREVCLHLHHESRRSGSHV